MTHQPQSIIPHSTADARVYGSPGTRVRIMGLLKTQWPLLLAVAMSGYLLRAALPWPPIGSTLAGLLFLALAIGVAAAANHSRKQLQAFLKGAKGEEVVARALAKLPASFSVFHGIAAPHTGIRPRGGNDFDHVVVGSNGIFVIETKNWAGAVKVENGAVSCDGVPPSRPPLDQVKRAAVTLRARLYSAHGERFEVQPVLCFASNALATDRQGAAGVLVCNANTLMQTLCTAGGTPLADTNRKQITDTLRADCES